MKKKRMTAILMAGVLMLGGCGKAADTAEVQKEVPAVESEQEESVQEEESEERAEGEAESEKTEMEPKEEEPVYEEDKNIYGNTSGNLYNEGTFIYNEEDGCLYFQNIYNKHTVKTDAETGNTVSLIDGPMLFINLYDGKLYGVETADEQKYGKMYVYDLQADTLEVIREEPTSYLQVADGILYFTDDADHTLRKMDAESREETILVEEPVYFPTVYKDSIIFQLDSDKESLYSIPKDGGEMVKLNDVRSYEPMVYRDRIYYKALDKNEQYTVRGMDLDGSNEEIILPVGTLGMNIHNGTLYYVLQDTPNMVFYIDLSDEARNAHELELADLIRSALKNTYGTTDLQLIKYGPLQFSGSYMIFMDMMRIGEQSYADEYIYNMDTEEIYIIPEYCKEKEDTIAKQETVADAPAASEGGQPADAGQETASAPAAGTQESDKDAQARAVAQSIADSIPAGSDLERVRAAAAAVAGYCSRATYTNEDPDYKSAYGVFCKGVYTCAGATRALGLVLECMGYSWSHQNANQWTHQWCELTMDGQKGWADGMGGIADYGECPFATGGTYTTPDGTTYFVP